MMLIMDGKSFIKHYIKENPNKVLKTQYVIVSSTIRKTGRYEKQVINGNNILYPSTDLIIDTDDYKNDITYKKRYFSQLEKSIGFIATLIKYSIEEDYTIVFLCGNKEKKYKYLDLMRDFIFDRFHYEVYKYKDKIPKDKNAYKEEVSKQCNKILKQQKKENEKKLMTTERGRQTLTKNMDKKALKKMLKKANLYVDGMSMSEMREMFEIMM